MKHPVERAYAYLPSKGLNERRATLHKYDHSQMVTKPPLERGGKPQTGTAHFFRCTETDSLRQWGFDRLPPTIGN